MIKTWWLRFRMRQVVLELLISVCLACLVWLYTHNRARHTLEHVAVPVQVQLAPQQRDQFSLDLTEQRTVLASFSGPQSRMREVRRKLQRGLLKAMLTVIIPEDKKTEEMFTEVLHVDEESIEVPPGIKVELAQDSVSVMVHRLTERSLPVRLEFTGEARVSQIKIEPATVLVRGPKSVLDQASFLSTKPYAIQVNADAQPSADSKVRDQVSLVTELDGRPITVNPASVQFRCVAVPKQKLYELTGIPVHFLCPKDCPWKPRFEYEKESKTALKLIGPVMEQTPPLLAFIDLTSGNLAPGRNFGHLRLQLPKDFQLADPTPPLVSFYLDEVARTGD
jgi:hypothetical protein